jgi:purine-nucleoside phosphorylase
VSEGSTATDVLRRAIDYIRARVPEPAADAALILGTGLGGVAAAMHVDAELAYEEIPGMRSATVSSHAGRLLFGRLAGRRVMAMQGRHHAYEGHPLRDVVLPVRVARLLGARLLVLSGATGCMNPLWQAGDLVVLADHLNLMGDNPLVGPNLDELGPRFPDMSEPYDAALQRLAHDVALAQGIALRTGVYAAVTGPNLETRAEYRMLRGLGADLVGMSTVPEVIAARHAGMRVLAISIVTDMCLPDALEPTDIDTIIRTAADAEPRLARLLEAVLARINDDSGAAAAVAVGGGA